jgi:hypothetical protein
MRNNAETNMRLNCVLLLACLAIANAHGAGQLLVDGAWIRTPPPGMLMLAGYATLHNGGDAPITVSGAESADFAAVSLHQSVTENGVERMRPLGEFTIAPGARVDFAPGGKHFMLMGPKRELKAGDTVKIHISTNSGAVDGEFVVRDAAP